MADELGVSIDLSHMNLYAFLPGTSQISYDAYTTITNSNKELITQFQSIRPEMVGSKVDKHPIHTGIGYEHKSSTEIPDYVTCLTGYRVWKVEYRYLYSIAWRKGLAPGIATKALCARANYEGFKWYGPYGGHDTSTAPVEQCGCGYYSFKSLEDLATGYSLDDYREMVVGVVDIWGRVIEHEKGYRSEYMYPRELWISRPEHEYLGEMYGVPIRKAY